MLIMSHCEDTLVYINVALGAMLWVSKLVAQILHL